MLIHIRQAKGCMDRTVMLSRQLLQRPRAYVRAVRPGSGLVPGAVPARLLGVRSPQKASDKARQACGLHKHVTVFTRCVHWARQPANCTGPSCYSAPWIVGERAIIHS
jgi:hypothetical protein